MLIIEGTDGLGKTTLVKKLVAALEPHGPWVGQHFTRLPLTWQHPESYQPFIHQYVVRDRFHMSEPAYSYGRGEKTNLTDEKYRIIDSWCRLVGAFTVVLVTPDHSFISDLHDDMYDDEVIIRANDWFRQLQNSSEYDWDMILEVPSYPDETDIDHILTCYLERQRCVKEICE